MFWYILFARLFFSKKLSWWQYCYAVNMDLYMCTQSLLDIDFPYCFIMIIFILSVLRLYSDLCWTRTLPNKCIYYIPCNTANKQITNFDMWTQTTKYYRYTCKAKKYYLERKHDELKFFLGYNVNNAVFTL